MNVANSDLEKAIKNIEKEIDQQISELSIWKHSFQTIFCSLLYIAEKIDVDGSNDSAMDYLSRTSVLWPTIISLSQKEEILTTVDSINASLAEEGFVKDIMFLYSYAHFSMIMPQIHRNIFSIKKFGNKYSLKYKSEGLKTAELKDKILSSIAQESNFTFGEQNQLDKYLASKIRREEYDLDNSSYPWIVKLYDHHRKHSLRVEVLNDSVLEPHIGFKNDEFNRFWASAKALSDFLLSFGRMLKNVSDTDENSNKNFLMSEYFEWTICTHTFEVLKNICAKAEITEAKFNTIFSYYCLIYQSPENLTISSNAKCGDGYLPPFVLTRDHVIYTPLTIRYFSPFNNILYSINQMPLFENTISQNLEPTLIEQSNRVFKQLPGLRTEKNIIYNGGEIDFMVLSENEAVCLSFQVKATIAPASTRGVSRVEGRSLEGINQIDRFERLDIGLKTQFINKTFRTSLPEIKSIGILLVRSSAGSDKVWNSGKTICNYALLCGLIGKKIKERNTQISEFDVEIRNYIDQLIEVSEWELTTEEFKLSTLELEFSDISYNQTNVIARNLLNSAPLGDIFSS